MLIFKPLIGVQKDKTFEYKFTEKGFLHHVHIFNTKDKVDLTCKIDNKIVIETKSDRFEVIGQEVKKGTKLSLTNKQDQAFDYHILLALDVADPTFN